MMTRENKMFAVLYPHFGHVVKCTGTGEMLCDTCGNVVLGAEHELLKNDSWKRRLISEHANHHVVIAVYGEKENPADVCLECEDCSNVIISAEDYSE